jgi:hypothetical protein
MKLKPSMPSPQNPEGISSGLTRLLGIMEPSLWDEFRQTLRTPVDPLWHQLIGSAWVSSCPWKLMELLISMHPEKLQHADQNGWLPLHHVVATPQGDQGKIICMILEANPAAAYQSKERGCLPFHLACLSGKGAWLLDLLKPYNVGTIYQPDGGLGLPSAVLLAAQSPSEPALQSKTYCACIRQRIQSFSGNKIHQMLDGFFVAVGGGTRIF